MASELKRGAIRVFSNYARLGSLWVLGIIFVPIFISGIGMEAYGLFGLLGSTFGIAEMCKSIVRSSMNRELGAAYNSADPDDFPNAYNSALVISAALGLITAAIFVGLYFLLSVLTISDELLPAAQWFVIAKGFQSVLVVLTGPAFNMYLVSERLVLFNLWIVLNRASDFIAAIVLFVLLGINDPATGLTAFAVISAAACSGVVIVAVLLMALMDRRILPDTSRISATEVRKILGTASWNTATVAAINLHSRVSQILMNVFFGLIGNGVFTIAEKLTSYIRIVAFGGTDGLDVVSARLSQSEKGMSVAQLMHYATRMHAVMAFPAGVLVFILAYPLIELWLGRALDSPEQIAKAVVLSQILVVGMTARGISDSWTRILYGAGYIRRYAPIVLAGGVANPIVALVLIWSLPESVGFTGPAIAFAAVFTFVHFICVPIIGARCLSIRTAEIFTPLLKPALVSALSGTVLLVPYLVNGQESPIVLLFTLGAFAALHAGLCWFFVLIKPERERFTGIIARKTGLQLPAWAQA